MRSIELLAPAKDLECGVAAISHGADAVYIGAEKFGARAAAGNSIEDITQLCEYAHKFGAKVYVTVNTIVYDNELGQLKDLLAAIDKSGADAILVQDMAVLSIVGEHSRMKLHASTQTDNRNAEKVEWLRDAGFSRAVLARELSLQEIAGIHQRVPDIEIEVFVHGAVCVSYSGACYASQHCFGRSANRGECAQFCRLQFDMEDREGKKILKSQYPLSLKDMCRINNLEQLIEAGVTSLKIEGRLKSITYVKNVVAAYSRELDKIIGLHPDKYRRASAGKSEYTFEPNLSKSFNRGFTDYFLYGRKPNISSMLTPKSLGECVGRVKETDKKSFTVAGTAVFTNGDGLCYINGNKALEGFRVNKAANNRLFPAVMPPTLRRETVLYRNFDQAFERALIKETATRKVRIKASLHYEDCQLRLSLQDENNLVVTETATIELETAQKPQKGNIERQLQKFGNTIYEVEETNIDDSVSDRFIPSNVLADLRRRATKRLSEKRETYTHTESKERTRDVKRRAIKADEINIANISNHLSMEFYIKNGIKDIHDDNEKGKANNTGQPVMTCRYCIKNELGYCVRHGGKTPKWKEPLLLRSKDGRSFIIEFECKKCQMKIYAND